MSKRAIIIGITGQDGSYLSRYLLQNGYDVVGFSRNLDAASMNNLEKLGIKQDIQLLSVDVYDFGLLSQVIKQIQPDEIYHLGGQSSVGLSFEKPFETNKSIIDSTLNILEVVRHSQYPIKFYNACSSECFGDVGECAATELTPFNPKSPYAIAKAAAYAYVKNYRETYGLYVCSGILFNHESALRPDKFVTKKIINGVKNIVAGSESKLVLGNVKIVRDWGWAPEYVEAMSLMLNQEKPEDFVIATGHSDTLLTFIDLAFQYYEMNYNDYIVIDKKLVRPNEIMCSRGNPAKARKLLNWQAKYNTPDIVKMMIEGKI